jgi:hypothetical protein
MRGAQE